VFTRCVSNGHTYDDACFDVIVCTVCGTARDITYTISDGCVTITGYTGSYTDLAIPANIEGYPVTVIGVDVFRRSTLVSVSIPATVTVISEGAFDRCSDLSTVYYNGTASQWESINIGEYNENLTEAALVFPLCVSNGHTYDNACDTDCNVCGEIREITHSYDNACDTDCNVCGEIREITHSYDNACDTDCNVCGDVREITHSYADATCALPMTCTVCGATEGEALEHSFDGIVCTVCGTVKDVTYTISDGRVTITKYTGSATELIIPATIEGCPVTVLGDDAFYRCTTFTSITIPDTVTLIDVGAFDRCTGLETVYYGGTEEQWSQIIIGEYNDDLTGAKIICAEDEPEIPVEPTYSAGDLNGDGNINAMDINVAKRILSGSVTPSDAQSAAGDMDGDGQFNGRDSNLLARKVAGV